MKKNYVVNFATSLLFLTILCSGVNAGWEFDSATKTFTITGEEGLCKPIGFYWQPYLNDPNYVPESYMYDHNMFYKSSSWFGTANTNMTSSNTEEAYPFAPDENHFAEFRVVSPDIDICGVKTSVWHNGQDILQNMDIYQSYLDEDDVASGYSTYFAYEDWSRGSPAGTGYGNTIRNDVGISIFTTPKNNLRLRYDVMDMHYILDDPDTAVNERSASWDEMYGYSWAAYVKSNETEFHDYYLVDPLNEANGPSSIQSSSNLAWNSYMNGMMVSASGGVPASCIYYVLSKNPIKSIDVRVKSPDMGNGGIALMAATDCVAHIGVSLSPDGPWTDVWTGSSATFLNSSNPGGTLDLSAVMPEGVYVRIYTTTVGSNYYVQIAGIQISLDTVPYDCQEVIARGQGYAGDIDGDCDVDTADLALMVDDWLAVSEPAN